MENYERRSAYSADQAQKLWGSTRRLDDQLITTWELIKGEYKSTKAKGTNVTANLARRN